MGSGQSVPERLRGYTVPHDVDGHRVLDDAYAFFQNCHHLKDWLKNDPESGFTLKEPDAVVKGSPVLTLCAEVANGSKHLLVDSGYLAGDVNVIVGEGVVHHFNIVSKREPRDAVVVATNAVKEWEAVLRQKGKLPAASAG